MPRCLCVVFVVAASAAQQPIAHGDIITNGDFETGDFSGWTFFTTPDGDLGVPEVVPFDTNNDSIATNGGRFQVGTTIFDTENTITGGGGIYQTVTTDAGFLDLSADIASDVFAPNLARGVVELLFDGTIIDSHGFVINVDDEGVFSSLAGTVSDVAAGPHEVRIRFTRWGGSLSESPLLYIDNITATQIPEPASLSLLAVLVFVFPWRRRRCRSLEYNHKEGRPMKARRISYCLSFVFAVVVTLVADTPHALGDIITNGDFEAGDFTGWTFFTTPDGDLGVPEVVPFDTNNDSVATSSGRFQVGVAIFDGETPSGLEGGGIYQIVTTDARILNLSADIASDVLVPNASRGIVELLFDGAVIDTFGFAFNTDDEAVFSSLAGTVSDVVAGPHEVRILFTRLGGNSTESPYLYIDNITVTQVPEPASLSLLAAFGLICPWRRRKWRSA